MTNISITALIIGSMTFGGIAAEVGIAPTIRTASRLYAIRNYWDMNTPTWNEAKRIREWLEGLTEAVGNVENAQTDIGIRTAQAFLLGLR